MNLQYENVKFAVKHEWQRMSLMAKCSTILISSLLLLSSLFTGFLIFSISLIIGVILFACRFVEKKIPPKPNKSDESIIN